MNFSFPTVTIYLIKVLVLLQQNACDVNREDFRDSVIQKH